MKVGGYPRCGICGDKIQGDEEAVFDSFGMWRHAECVKQVCQKCGGDPMDPWTCACRPVANENNSQDA